MRTLKPHSHPNSLLSIYLTQCNYSPGEGGMIGILGQNIFKVSVRSGLCRCLSQWAFV